MSDARRHREARPPRRVRQPRPRGQLAVRLPDPRRDCVRPIDRVAVAGISGLGHLALQYRAKWGCDVTAIRSSRDINAALERVRQGKTRYRAVLVA